MATDKEKQETPRQNEFSITETVTWPIFGAFYTVLGSFPIAAFVALVFRFPFPFAEYDGGVDAMIASPLAVIFYGIIGGFPLLAMLGAIAGGVARLRHKAANTRHKHRELLIVAVVINFVAVMLLAVWDKIYGPW